MPVKQLMQCGATYFHATDKGDHPQQECFRIAKDLDHQFFVSCESSRGRMFASYESADDFYGHYLQFKGTRSFYQINRSIELGHVSKLYLDIEWKTNFADESASSRIKLIVDCIENVLDRQQHFIEDLTRTHKDGYVKNSFHIYFSTLFQNNKVVHQWLETVIWPRISSNPDMYDEKKKPIIDFGV